MLSSISIVALLTTFPVSEDVGLSPKWHGTWHGTMTTVNSMDLRRQIAVVFEVKPIKKSRALTWRMTYGTGDKKLVKNYKLIPKEKSPGRFLLDEGNGVALPARMVGDVIYSQFKAGDLFLTARYELRGKELHFELTSAQPQKLGRLKVLAVRVVQSVLLRRKKRN